MNYNLIKRLIICFSIGIFITTVGCATNRVTEGYEEDSNQGYSEPDNKHKYKKGGPPDHAPAHGYRAKYQYRYYPSQSIYYDTDRGIYFYLKGDSWEVGASLPSSLRVRLGDSVSIELDTDEPYIYHADHVRKYPPGQLKKKNKTKGKWIYGLVFK